MSVLDLARLQFAFTTVYHFLFVPLTLGLSIIVAIMHTMYFASKDPGRKETMKRLTKYFGALFIINYAIGIVTGIVQEFQFGMGWADYSRYVGDIFGAPLAVEALLAFFIESTFLGVWAFGWDKLPKAVHLATIWLVAVASNISAYVILAANTWMQHPVGFTVNQQAGRAELNDFLRVVLNSQAGVTFAHVFTTAAVTSCIFVAAIAGYNVIKKNEHGKPMLPVLATTLAAAVVFTFLALNVTGDMSAVTIMNDQPLKLAAAVGTLNQDATSAATAKTAEASGAAASSADLVSQFEQKFGPGDYYPPAAATRVSFQVMVYGGYVIIGLSLLVLALLVVLRLVLRMRSAAYLWLLFIALPLPYICNTAGWLVREFGRLPFSVYGFLLLKDSISPTLQSSQVLFSLIAFTLVYLVLAVIGFGLMIKYVRNNGKFDDQILE